MQKNNHDIHTKYCIASSIVIIMVFGINKYGSNNAFVAFSRVAPFTIQLFNHCKGTQWLKKDQAHDNASVEKSNANGASTALFIVSLNV